MAHARIRTVEGSCRPCRRRRIICDLAQPTCTRCHQIGAQCHYEKHSPRWATQPTRTAPATYQIIASPGQSKSLLRPRDRRALDYFDGRFWPLLTTATTPCAPPTLLATEHPIVLLAVCVLADTHRVLQDGRNSLQLSIARRGQCLEAVRQEVDGCCNAADAADVRVETLRSLLLAVLLLYFDDGFLLRSPASTGVNVMYGHRDGLRAIIGHLGGLDAIVSDACPDFVQLLVSEFASSDLTMVLLRGGIPAFPPEAWNKFEQGKVWWTGGARGRECLAGVFQQMARLACCQDLLKAKAEALSMREVREFEAALTPVYLTVSVDGDNDDAFSNRSITQHCHTEDSPLATFSMIRSFQHAALIYLYRAICSLPASHPLVQQHAIACLDTINAIDKSSKVIYCVTFPLLVAGSHVQSATHRGNAIKLVDMIHSEVKFASVRSVGQFLHAIWKGDCGETTWFSMFQQLELNTIVL